MFRDVDVSGRVGCVGVSRGADETMMSSAEVGMFAAGARIDVGYPGTLSGLVVAEPHCHSTESSWTDSRARLGGVGFVGNFCDGCHCESDGCRMLDGTFLSGCS